MTTPETDPLDAPTAALAAVALEVARHLEDSPLARPQLFALVRSATLLAMSPGVASLLGLQAGSDTPPDDLHLTPIDLDDGTELPADPVSALQEAQWPEHVAGGALACDLAPSAWTVRDGVDSSPLGAEGALRVVVAALSDGTTWTAIRRSGDAGYVMGEALVPDLTAALTGTLPDTD